MLYQFTDSINRLTEKLEVWANQFILMFSNFVVASLLILVFCSLNFNSEELGSHATFQAKQLTEPELARQYVQELKKFVRSIGKEKYQPDGYWKEVDKLWQSFKTRQENLSDQFSQVQWERIRKLEQKYLEIRKRQTRLS